MPTGAGAAACRRASSPDMPGFDFVLGGRYRLLGPLGEGGMATVYRGRDLRLNRDVAIKILKDDLTKDPTFLKRFEREAQVVASLSHPNIVPVYDVGEEGRSRYIVMEYVPGRTLRDAIERDGFLTANRAVPILDQVLDALQYAHERGLIHRDVKPHNILMTVDGTARLTDFGIAHLTGDSTTRTAAILGSAHYLSPEQSQGQEATAASDLYACGVVLFEMLSGRPPFDGPNPLAIATQHVHDEPPPLLDASTAAQATLSTALAKNPSDRFPDAASFRRALHSIEADAAQTVSQPLTVRGAHPVEAPAVSSDEIIVRRSARRSYLLAITLAAIGAAAWYAVTLPVLRQQIPDYPNGIQWAVPALVALVAFWSWIQSRSWSYSVNGEAAVVRWGVLSHHRLGLPLHGVTTVQLKQNVLDRLLGIGTVEMIARTLDGQERRLVMEDMPHPRDTYDTLMKLVAQSVRQFPREPARTSDREA